MIKKSLTRLPNFCAISTLWWDPRASKKTFILILIGHPRVQHVFSFYSLVDSPKKEKKKINACNLLNTSYNVVTKQFILKICIQYNFLNRNIENRDPLQLVGKHIQFRTLQYKNFLLQEVFP